jgi:hypothetical protein
MVNLRTFDLPLEERVGFYAFKDTDFNLRLHSDAPEGGA